MLQNQIKCYVLWCGMNFFEGYVILGIRYLICYGYFTFRNNQQFIFAFILVIGLYSFFLYFLSIHFSSTSNMCVRSSKICENDKLFFVYILYLSKVFFPLFLRNEWQIWLSVFSALVINLYIVG